MLFMGDLLTFLSTLSLRRATAIHDTQINEHNNFYPRSPCGERRSNCNGRRYDFYFYPRSPCGERPFYQYRKSGKQGISIHALLAESDLKRPKKPLETEEFLSTLSLRRATNSSVTTADKEARISIHALLAESDSGHCEQ